MQRMTAVDPSQSYARRRWPSASPLPDIATDAACVSDRPQAGVAIYAQYRTFDPDRVVVGPARIGQVLS